MKTLAKEQESEIDGGSGDVDPTVDPAPRRAPARQLSVSLPKLLTATAMAVLAAVACTFAVLYFGAHGDLADRDAAAADTAHAQQVALDYSVRAATVDYHDTKTWYGNLKQGTAPNLAGKFDATSAQLDQILLPLQWTSKATPITAAVTSSSNGVYKINAFLQVTSTSAQNPQGGQTTVTYSITVDKNNNWQITDVGGADGAFPIK